MELCLAKMLVDRQNKSISFSVCALQFLVFCILYGFWISSAGSDGLWLVQDHQQPLALCGQHVQWDELPARGWGLPGGNDRLACSIPLMFLGKMKVTISYVIYLHFPPFLLWYTGQWIGIIPAFDSLNWVPFQSPCLLLLYYSFSLEDPLCWGRFKTFFPAPPI